MTPTGGLSILGVFRDFGTILGRFGIASFADFLALSFGLTTLRILLAPTAYRASLADPAPDSALGLFSVFFDPSVASYILLHSVVFGAACLRIWWAHPASAQHAPVPVAAWLGPLLVLDFVGTLLVYAGLFLLFLPGLVVMSLLTLLTPAVVIEGFGWQGIARSVALCRPHIIPLSAIFAAILLPSIWLQTMMAPRDWAADPVGLWLGALPLDLVSAGISTASLCVVMAVYLQIVGRARSRADDLEDIFR